MIDFVSVFNKSYENIHKNSKTAAEFYDYFYGSFLAQAPSIPTVFTGSDMDRLKIMLRDSLIQMKEFFTTKQSSDHLMMLAKLHSKSQKDINPELYDFWLKSLIESVKAFDPDFNKQVELAWRVVMAPGIAFMSYAYSNEID